MNLPITLVLVSTIVSYLLFIYLRIKRMRVFALLAKALTSLLFCTIAIICAISRDNITPVMLIMIFGLVFGLIGDVLLDLKVIYQEDKKAYLNSGICSFSIGHILYLIALVITAVNLKVYVTESLLISGAIGVAFVAITIIGIRLLKYKMESYLLQSVLYGFLLAFVGAFCTCIFIKTNQLGLNAIGLCLFLASDIVLSAMYYGGKEENNKYIIINHTLYYSAQILIALSILSL